MCLCLSLLYRNPNGWTDLDEIWHSDGPRGGGEGSWVSTRYPHPPDLVKAGYLFGSQILIWKDLGPLSF